MPLHSFLTPAAATGAFKQMDSIARHEEMLNFFAYGCFFCYLQQQRPTSAGI
jgi:hypothetical protein